MGDNLPEFLYRAWCSALGLSGDGSDDTPSYDELPAERRGAWEQVAAEARTKLGVSFAIDMREATAEYGAEQAIANLLEARLGT